MKLDKICLQEVILGQKLDASHKCFYSNNYMYMNLYIGTGTDEGRI